MKTLPSASIRPETNFQVWATMALVPDAIVLALGRFGRLGGWARCCPFGPCRASNVRKLVSTPRSSRNVFTVTTCERIVAESAVACCAMVAPPSTITVENRPARNAQTITSRKHMRPADQRGRAGR